MTTLKGVFPDPKPARRKNFIQENVKSLRRMEQCFHANKEIGELQKLQLHKHQKAGDKYQNISARVNTSLHDKNQEDTNANSLVNDINKQQSQKLHQKTSAPVLDKKQIVPTRKVNKSSISNNIMNKQKKKEHSGTNKHKEFQKKFLSDPNVSQKSIDSIKNNDDMPVTYKSRGIQTLDTKQIDALYAEGTIRYPRRNTNPDVMNKVTSIQQTEEISKDTSDSVKKGDVSIPEITQDSDFKNSQSPPPQEATDFIKQNKERISIASKIATQLNNGVPPANYRKGVVPKYIRDRKEAHEKEQKAKAAASHPDCPEGHVPLPDNERKETLRMLKKNYQDYINELNMMPIKTDTLRAQRRKMEIEKQLNKLEEGIKVFSRPKVYVKINA